MAFHKRKFPLVSFSCGGDPRDPAVVLEEDDAKAEDEVVVSVPVVLDSDAAVVVDMSLGRGLARCDLFLIYRGRGTVTM